MTTTENFFAFNNTKHFGRALPAAITPTMDGTEALALAGIDWEVTQTKLSDTVEFADVPGAKDVVISQRSDNGGIVGSNGKQYTVIQNTALAELGDAIRKVRPDARFVSGGEKNGGKTTFLMLQLDPSGFKFGAEDDTIHRNILLFKGHDGGKLKGLPVGFRPACLNQWSQLIRTSGEQMVAVAHTATASQRLFQAVQAVQVAVAAFDEWDVALQQLLNTPLRANDIFKRIAGDRPDEDGRALTEWENRLDNLWAEYSEDFNTNLVGTAAGIVMAAQGADEHRGRCGKGNRETQRMGRVLTGSYPMAQRAMDLVGA